MDVIDGMRVEITKNLVKYAAGQHQFCKYCGKLLDWTDTVLADCIDDDRNESLYIGVCCGNCFDSKVGPNLDQQGADMISQHIGCKVRFEITDGRELAGRELA